MRRPIRWQLVIPTVAFVAAAILAASGASGLLAAREARRQQQDALRRVAGTLTEAAFPLTDSVLAKMSGLSGAEFILIDREGRQARATLPLDAAARDQLARLPAQPRLLNLADSPTVNLAARRYFAGRLSLAPSPSFTSGGSLVVLYPEDQWSRLTREALWAPLALGGAVAVLAAVVMSLLARRLVRPLDALRRRAAEVAAGDYLNLPEPATNDELRDLIVAFNDMTDRLSRSEERVRRSERLSVLGRVSAGMAHQLRNAVTGARMALDLHERECPQPLGDDALAVAGRQLKLMEAHLQRFLTLGRPWSGQPTTLDLADAANDALALVAHHLRHAEVIVEQRLPDQPVRAVANREALRQALVNLLINAQEALASTPRDRRLRVELAASGGAARVIVADRGPGPPEELAARIFEPLVSSRPEGTGLGLAVAREIAEAHGGGLTFRREGEWTVFELVLPLADGVAADPFKSPGPRALAAETS